MSWWHENRMRMIQFNLQQEDAAIDAEQIVSFLKEHHANAIMTGAGGIVAYYPTELSYHYRSPYLEDRDMFGDLVKACHREGIRVIARFDFSKIHESIAKEHEDWLYRDAEGHIVNYHGMVHACLSSEYEWEHSIDILTECLTKYQVDGVYLNMFGYATRDYDMIDHGMCHCENCKRLFAEETGSPFPSMTDAQGVAQLKAWQRKRSGVIMHRVNEAIKKINPEISVSMHVFDKSIDMVHTESNTALHRPLPLWEYMSFDNVRIVNDQDNGMVSANCCINAADLAWRFTGISTPYIKARLWQQVAAGGQPEWCIVGTPWRYPDKSNFDAVKEVYAFHEKNAKFFGPRRTLAKIAVARYDVFAPEDGQLDEYRGVVRALKEAHYQFDVIRESNLSRLADRYDLIILPDSRIKAASIPTSCHILATGNTFRNEADALKAYFGAELVRTEQKTLGAYFETTDKTLFKRLPQCYWVLLDGNINLYKGDGVMPYMAPGVFGPVEIAGGVFPSEYNGAIIKETGGKKRVLMPWWPGRLYTRCGYMQHRDILLDIIDSILGPQETQFDAPDMIDVYYDACEDGRILQMVNLSGYSGTTVHAPIPVSGIKASVPGNGLRRIIDLNTEKEIPFSEKDGQVTFEMPAVDYYAAVLLEN